jgi:hypothetical protein
MKKILTTFLISLTLLTFSNTSFAGFFGDIIKEFFGEPKSPSDLTVHKSDVDEVRCKIEYTQLDLATGLEKKIKHTTQFDTFYLQEEDSLLYFLVQDLTDKINIWLNENKRNVITDLTVINCKERRTYFRKLAPWHTWNSNQQRWGEYKGCPDEFNIQLIDFIEHPKQWGYNVHKERLIKDYEEGCKDYGNELIIDL